MCELLVPTFASGFFEPSGLLTAWARIWIWQFPA